MALHNPSALYSGGQGIFDSSPYTRAYLTYEAKKKAQNEALDKYFQELPSKVNAAGVRDQDRPTLDKKFMEIKADWLQNRDAIKRGGAAAYNYEQRVRDYDKIVNESKNAAKEGVEFWGVVKQKGNEHISNDPTLTEKVKLWELPVGHPDRQSLNLPALIMPPKPLTDEEHRKSMGWIKPDGIEEKVQVDPNDNLKDIVTQTPIFSPNNLDNLATRSLEKYYTSPSYKKRVDELMNNTSARGEYEEIYERYFKKKPQRADEFAVAYDLSALKLPQLKRNRIVNISKREAAHDAYVRGRAKAKGGDDAVVNDVYDQVYAQVDTDNQKGFGTRINALTSEGANLIIEMAKKMTGKPNLGWDDIWLTKDEDGDIVIYKADQRKMIIDPKQPTRNLIGKVPKVGLNLKVQPNSKSKVEVVKEGNKKEEKTSNGKLKVKGF